MASSAWWLVGILKDAIAGKLSDKLRESFENGNPGDSLAGMNQVLQEIKDLNSNFSHMIEAALNTKIYADHAEAIETMLTDHQGIAGNLERAKKGNKAALEEHRALLRSQAANDPGINWRMKRIHSLLIGKSEYFGKGMITTIFRGYEKTMTSDLSVLKKDYIARGVEWYMRCTSAFIAHTFHVQMTGLAVQIFMSTGETVGPPKTYISELKARLEEQLKFAHTQLHPFVANLKQSFLAPMDSNRWWRVVANDGRSIRRDPNGLNKILLDYTGVSKDTIWRFEAPPDVSTTTAICCMDSQYPIFLSLWGSRGSVRGDMPMISCRDRAPVEENTNYQRVWEHVVLRVGIRPVKQEERGEEVIPNSNFRFFLYDEKLPTGGITWSSISGNWLFNTDFHLDGDGIAQVPVWNPISTWWYPYEGKLVKGRDGEVFLVLDYTLRWFSSEVAFGIFGDAWPQRCIEAWADIDTLPKGEPLLDGRLIKAGTGIHLVDNGRKRWIESTAIASRYGFDLSRASDIGQDFHKFPVGPKIGSSEAEKFEGKLVKGDGSPTVYIVLDRALRGIPDMEVYKRLFGNRALETWAQNGIDGLPKGSWFWSSSDLIRKNKITYLYDNGRLRIVSPDQVARYGLHGQTSNLISKGLPIGVPVGDFKMEQLAGLRIQGNESDKCYLVLDKVLRHIPNEHVYRGLWGNNSDIEYVPQKMVDTQFPAFIALVEHAKLFAGGGGRIFLVDHGQKRYISGEAFKQFGFDWGQVDRSDSSSDNLREGNPVF